MFENQIEQVKDKRVVLLQSGGLDSCFLTCLLHHYGFEIHSVFVNYGQNAYKQELKASKAICERYNSVLHEVDLTLPWLKDSTVLAGHKVGSYNVPDKLGSVEAKVYVPMRNHLLLSIAGSLAESLNIPYIASAIDGAEDLFCKPLTGCPDKHPLFVKRIEKSLTEGSAMKHKYGNKFILITPLLYRTKEETIKRGIELSCDFSLSWTCYNNSDKPCGECCACLERKNSFKSLGIEEKF